MSGQTSEEKKQDNQYQRNEVEFNNNNAYQPPFRNFIEGDQQLADPFDYVDQQPSNNPTEKSYGKKGYKKSVQDLEQEISSKQLEQDMSLVCSLRKKFIEGKWIEQNDSETILNLMVALIDLNQIDINSILQEKCVKMYLENAQLYMNGVFEQENLKRKSDIEQKLAELKEKEIAYDYEQEQLIHSLGCKLFNLDKVGIDKIIEDCFEPSQESVTEFIKQQFNNEFQQRAQYRKSMIKEVIQWEIKEGIQDYLQNLGCVKEIQQDPFIQLVSDCIEKKDWYSIKLNLKNICSEDKKQSALDQMEKTFQKIDRLIHSLQKRELQNKIIYKHQDFIQQKKLVRFSSDLSVLIMNQNQQEADNYIFGKAKINQRENIKNFIKHAIFFQQCDMRERINKEIKAEINNQNNFMEVHQKECQTSIFRAFQNRNESDIEQIVKDYAIESKEKDLIDFFKKQLQKYHSLNNPDGVEKDEYYLKEIFTTSTYFQ